VKRISVRGRDRSARGTGRLAGDAGNSKAQEGEQAHDAPQEEHFASQPLLWAWWWTIVPLDGELLMVVSYNCKGNLEISAGVVGISGKKDRKEDWGSSNDHRR